MLNNFAAVSKEKAEEPKNTPQSAIIGGVVGGIVVILAVVIGLFFLRRLMTGKYVQIWRSSKTLRMLN